MHALKIEIPLGQIAALRNGGHGPHVLALHGWLDNAASFLPLSAHLDGVDLVAIDLPGHGQSAHLPAGTDYGFAGALATVLDVADALGWTSFTLLGHSMGAGIASLLAAACPERIERLLAVEMLGALTDPPERTPLRMREALAQRTRVPRGLRVFPDIDTAVRARMHSERVPGNTLEAAHVRLLVERGLRQVADGYVWSSDPRLIQPSFTRLTEEQIEAVLAAIECPTLAVFADPAQPYLPDALRRKRLGLIAHGQLVVLPGGHHLHMQQADTVAAILLGFLHHR